MDGRNKCGHDPGNKLTFLSKAHTSIRADSTLLMKAPCQQQRIPPEPLP